MTEKTSSKKLCAGTPLHFFRKQKMSPLSPLCLRFGRKKNALMLGIDRSLNLESHLFRLWLFAIFTVSKWQMLRIKGSMNQNLFEGKFSLKIEIILWTFQLCCTLHVFRMYEKEKTLAGRLFQVHGMCLNLLLLNQRADSGSFSFYYPLETYSEYYVIKLGKGRECTASWTKATQTAVPVQTQQSDYLWVKNLGRPR